MKFSYLLEIQLDAVGIDHMLILLMLILLMELKNTGVRFVV